MLMRGFPCSEVDDHFDSPSVGHVSLVAKVDASFVYYNTGL